MAFLPQKQLGLSFVALALISVIAASVQSLQQTPPIPLLPGPSPLLAQAGSSPVVHKKSDAQNGVLFKAHDHNMVSCPESGSFPVLGSSLLTNNTARFWIYEYTGNEAQAFDGRFYISVAEFLAQNADVQRVYNTLLQTNGIITEFIRGMNYYIMSATDLQFTCGSGLAMIIECGDGILQQGEQCDDGNVRKNDGCSATCTVEEGFACTGEPSVCRRVRCGDGIIVGSETCDDGNLQPEDGCSETCATENGWKCTSEPSVCELLIPTLGEEASCSGGCDDGNFCTRDSCSEDQCIHEFDDTIAGCASAQANLYVTQSSVPIRHRQLLSGTVGESVLRFSLRAENEDIDVTNIAITSAGNRAESVEHLELYRVGETIAFAFATTDACNNISAEEKSSGPVRRFCATLDNRELILPSGETVEVVVRPRMYPHAQGAISGEMLRFSLPGAAFVLQDSSTVSAIQARDDQSGQFLAMNNGNASADGEVFIGTDAPGPNATIVSEAHQVVLAKISSITNYHTDIDGAAVPTGLAAIGVFRFTAQVSGSESSPNPIVDTIIFNVNAMNVAMRADSFLLSISRLLENTSCSTLYPDGSPYTDDVIAGNFLVECTDLLSSPLETLITNGSSTDFILQADVVNPNISPSGSSASLQVSLQNFTEFASTDTAASQSHLRWSDGNTTFLWLESFGTDTVRSTLYQN